MLEKQRNQLDKGIMMAHKYVGLGKKGEKIFLYNREKEPVRQVLWGDWLLIDEDRLDDGMGASWLPVKWGRTKELYIKKKDTIDKRPLEIIFVDVGQGDGSVLITPETGADERIMVIDAGEGGNMQAFLNGRFRAYRVFDFDSAVITHPDLDHYLGFKDIFSDHDIGFRTIYHSGLVERPVSGKFKKLGEITEDPENGEKYMVDLAIDSADIERIFRDPSKIGRFVFPGVMHEAIKNPKINVFKMLSTLHGTIEDNRTYMPGFAPTDGKDYTIEVLGPVAELDENDKPRLRRISSNYGKTKNGHSVILRLTYGKFRVLFGGDLNAPAEKFLLKHYTGRKSFPSKGSTGYINMVEEARNWFEAEVMKVCHHGSEKVTDAFMAAVNPACFVISSGDQEGYIHPRPDLLGRLGRLGRGEAPVILSTELQRSTREREDRELVEQLQQDIDLLAVDPTNELKEAISKQVRKLARTNVDVYGAIYVKTDGDRLITAFKIEAESDLDKWFYFEYSIDGSGILELI